MYLWDKEIEYPMATAEEKDRLFSKISKAYNEENFQYVKKVLGIAYNRYVALHFDDTLELDKVSMRAGITTANVEDIVIYHLKEEEKEGIKEFGDVEVTERLTYVEV